MPNSKLSSPLEQSNPYQTSTSTPKMIENNQEFKTTQKVYRTMTTLK